MSAIGKSRDAYLTLEPLICDVRNAIGVLHYAYQHATAGRGPVELDQRDLEVIEFAFFDVTDRADTLLRAFHEGWGGDADIDALVKRAA